MPKYDDDAGRGVIRAEDGDVLWKKNRATRETRVQMHTEGKWLHKLTVMRYGSCHLTLQDIQQAHRADDLIGYGKQLGGSFPVHRMGMVQGPRVWRTFLLEHPVQNQYHSGTAQEEELEFDLNIMHFSTE